MSQGSPGRGSAYSDKQKPGCTPPRDGMTFLVAIQPLRQSELQAGPEFAFARTPPGAAIDHAPCGGLANAPTPL
jgi:hypothetical protein